MTRKVAIAIAAHPDDIEFSMAGTLLQLRKAGYETHYLTIASGCCGSTKTDAKTTESIRGAEARVAAGILGAKFHPSFTKDLEIFYNLELLRAVAAVIREVKPGIVLAPSPQDYMEDHTNASRLAVTAAFVRGMPNFKTSPSRAAADGDVTIYHAMPHGLHDGLRCRIIPGAFVDTTGVHEIKRKALAAHKSQQDWLEESQGFNSFLQAMEDMSLTVGRLSKKFRHAEGWRRHLHLGFCLAETDPLSEALGKIYMVNKVYEQKLKRGI
jgi:LmbE family N-acetylglucosaminyl deacetylase